MNHAETVLLAHLTDPDSLDVLVTEGFSSEDARKVIPTQLAGDITAWCIELYFASGRAVAPTRAAIEETWADEMEKVDLTIEDDTETDSIQWAISELRSKYVEYESNKFVLEFGKAVVDAPPPERVGVLGTYAAKLYEMSHTVISHRQEAPADRGIADALERYHERAKSKNTVEGMTFGLPQIDEHTLGLRDGELGIFAGFSGFGKSWLGLKPALAEWERGRKSVLFTLENSTEMTFDRMACMAAGVDYEGWQRGDVDKVQLDRVKEFLEGIRDTEHAPIIIMPERGDRTALGLVRRAFSLGADSMILDQLSHVERKSNSKARERHHVFAENISEIKALISEGTEKLPTLVLHQIKRDGQTNARRTGGYEMDDMAESSQIEREADFVFSGFQNKDQERDQVAKFQILKARRRDKKEWLMHWRLDVGDIRVIRELIKDAED